MSELPATVRAFLDQHIFSASQLEVLLLLHDRPGRSLSIAETAREARLPASAIEPWLEAFAARGLLGHDADGYAFRPDDPGSSEVVAQVAEAYRRRRTTVSRYLYSRGQDPLTRFADAFRLRRDTDPAGSDEES